MKQFFQSKLTKRYLIISLLVTFCALGSLYLVTYHVMNTSVREEMEYRNQLMAKTIGKKTDYIFTNLINEARLVSGYVLKDLEEQDDFLVEMESVISRNPLYLHGKIFDQNGEIISTIPNVHIAASKDIGKIVERMSWSKTFFISNMMTLEDNKKTIAVAYPAIDKDENFKGGAILFINLHVLSQYLNHVKIGDEGINALIDRNGTLISHSNENYLGESLVGHTIAGNLYKSRSGIWEGVLFQQHMIFAYQPIQQGNFGIVVGEPVDQALAATKDVQSLLMKGLFAVLLLTFIFTILATSSFLKPINKLIKQAKEYKESKRPSFNIVKTGDELEVLSITMDEMAGELLNKEKRLFNILESIPYAVITTNKEGLIETFNKGAEQLTLYERGKVIGKRIIDLPIKNSKEEFFSWQTLQDGKEFNDVESHILDKEGKKHDVRIYSSLFYNENHDNIGAILIIRDVSEIKKLEEYLEQSERLAALGQLTAGIAHEIKNPLSIIIAAADAMELELKDLDFHSPLLKEMTADIIETSERMNNLLTDFLKMSKSEDPENITDVDLVAILAELLTLLRKKLDDHHIIVQQNFQVKTAVIAAVENNLNQVFLNIILNSIQAMENGGLLTIEVKEDELDWEVVIEDTGKGIAESEIKWIFNPFHTTKKEGTGLGLSIAYEIITQHEGVIEAFSSVGKGTTLIVRLPKGGRGWNNK